MDNFESPSKLTVDLNGDVGEGSALDAEFIPLLTSVNIACGAHAGDEASMRKALELSFEANVQIGAHPGFDDRENFGRLPRKTSSQEVYDLVIAQVDKLQALAANPLSHVKLHGALYHQAARDTELAVAVIQAVSNLNLDMRIVGPWPSELEKQTIAVGMTFVSEVFADRNYHATGHLVIRSDPAALVTDENQALIQSIRMVTEGNVGTLEGQQCPVRADTICLHGDSPYSASFALRLRRGLKAAGIEVRPF